MNVKGHPLSQCGVIKATFMRGPRCGSMVASRLCPKVDVMLWSSSRVLRRCSCAARSTAVFTHTGMDGTRAPSVWISNTVTTS